MNADSFEHSRMSRRTLSKVLALSLCIPCRMLDAFSVFIRAYCTASRMHLLAPIPTGGGHGR